MSSLVAISLAPGMDFETRKVEATIRQSCGDALTFDCCADAASQLSSSVPSALSSAFRSSPVPSAHRTASRHAPSLLLQLLQHELTSLCLADLIVEHQHQLLGSN